jgi:hypothetical protein
VYSLTELVTKQHKWPAVINTDDLNRKFAHVRRPHKVALNRLTYLLNTPAPDLKVLASIHDGKPRSRPERVVHNTTMFTELSDAHGGAPPPPRATPDSSRAPTPSPDASNQAGAHAGPTAHSPRRQGQGGTADPGASALRATPEGPAPPHCEPAATTTGSARANVPHAPRRLRQATMDAYTHMFVAQPTDTQAPHEPHPMHNTIAEGDDPHLTAAPRPRRICSP